MGRHACSQSKTLRAEETEALIWRFVSGVLRDPARLQRGLDKMLKQEEALAPRRPDGDEEGWLKKLSELDAQEERLLDLYLEGKLEVDRYESRISQIKQSRRTIEDELESINNRAIHIERLKHDRDALLSHYSQIVPECLDALDPHERNRVYKMLGLRVLAYEDGKLEAKWTLGGDPCRDNATPLRRSSTSTTNAFRFRAVLTGDGSQEVELARA